VAQLLKLFRELGFRRIRQIGKAKRDVWEQLISPHFTTRCIQAALSVGLIDAMRDEGAVDLRAFAEKRGLDGDMLSAVCGALCARGVLRTAGSADRMKLDKLGRFIADNNMARGWLELSYGYEPVLHNLEGLLRKEVRYNQEVVRDGVSVAAGSGLACADFYFPMIAAMIRRAGYGRVLDLGCGDGAFLRLLGRLGDAQGVGIDLSAGAVERGNQQLGAEGLGERFRLHVGDVRELDRHQDALGGVDSATMFFVLHELCDGKENQDVVEFLQSFRRTLPGVQLHVIETIRPTVEEMRANPGPAVEYFLFHDLSLQRPMDRAGWLDVFGRSGMSLVHEERVPIARTSFFCLQ